MGRVGGGCETPTGLGFGFFRSPGPLYCFLSPRALLSVTYLFHDLLITLLTSSIVLLLVSVLGPRSSGGPSLETLVSERNSGGPGGPSRRLRRLFPESLTHFCANFTLRISRENIAIPGGTLQADLDPKGCGTNSESLVSFYSLPWDKGLEGRPVTV